MGFLVKYCVWNIFKWLHFKKQIKALHAHPEKIDFPWKTAISNTSQVTIFKSHSYFFWNLPLCVLFRKHFILYLCLFILSVDILYNEDLAASSPGPKITSLPSPSSVYNHSKGQERVCSIVFHGVHISSRQWIKKNGSQRLHDTHFVLGFVPNTWPVLTHLISTETP